MRLVAKEYHYRLLTAKNKIGLNIMLKATQDFDEMIKNKSYFE